jgi:hypothetical protein
VSPRLRRAKPNARRSYPINIDFGGARMRRLTCLIAFTVLIQGASAAAQTPSAPAAEQAISTSPVVLDDGELATARAGDGVKVEILTRQQLTGSTTVNTVNANTLVSGSVNFSENALSNFNGIGNFVINTGANNTLQGAINVSVLAAPPAN